jgi:two-component system, response regulator PdtaR
MQMQPSASKRSVVLVVEDEPLIRIDAVGSIEAAGFDAVEAANADDAIAILGQRSDIRLVFTDVHMPGSMDGLKLAHVVSSRWPPVKVVATSGQARISAQDLPQGGRFLRKPYTATQIADTMRELIHG